MKLFLTIIPVVVVLMIFACSRRTGDDGKISGRIDDVEQNIAQLMKSDNEQAFLVIGTSENDEFIQFTPYEDGVQLDFPLITKRQEAREAQFKQIAKELKLKVIENEGTDGSRFLDIDLNGTAAEISQTVKIFLRKLYGLNDSSIIQLDQNF